MTYRVLGIDPGFDRVGVAVVDGVDLIYSSCIQTDRKLPHAERLLQIGKDLSKIITDWQPHSLAIEKLFFNQNTTNALKVSEARGVVIYEAKNSGLEIYEYSPQEVKIAVTSYGKADKSQVEMMVKRLVKIPAGKKKLDDEIDAIALGITHLASKKGI